MYVVLILNMGSRYSIAMLLIFQSQDLLLCMDN